jgi:hypothetical protein
LFILLKTVPVGHWAHFNEEVLNICYDKQFMHAVPLKNGSVVGHYLPVLFL